MAVVAVQPIHPRRRASYRSGIYSFFLMWLVPCDSQYDGPAPPVLASGIPPRGSVFVNVDGTLAYMTGVDVDPRGDSDRHFEVQVQFDSAPNEDDDNPLHQPP